MNWPEPQSPFSAAVRVQLLERHPVELSPGMWTALESVYRAEVSLLNFKSMSWHVPAGDQFLVGMNRPDHVWVAWAAISGPPRNIVERTVPMADQPPIEPPIRGIRDQVTLDCAARKRQREIEILQACACAYPEVTLRNMHGHSKDCPAVPLWEAYAEGRRAD